MPNRPILWTSGICNNTIEAILAEGILEIRDVVKGESPFRCTSHHVGPVYVGLKELISRTELFESLVRFLTDVVRRKLHRKQVQFIAGTATGGIVPGYEVSKRLRQYWNEPVPSGYVRDAAKNDEWLVGVKNNPAIEKGDCCLLVEELINFGETTLRSVRVLREAGYKITHVACFLWYKNPCAIKALKREGIEIIYLFTLPQLLNLAQKHGLYAEELFDQCREFLHDPIKWNEIYGARS